MVRKVRFTAEERLPDVIRLAKRIGALRSTDLATELELSSSGANSILRKLADKGLIVEHGHGRGRSHFYTVPTGEPVAVVKAEREPAQPTRLKVNGVTVADIQKAISFLDDEDEVLLMGIDEDLRVNAIQVQVSNPPKLVLIVSHE